MKRLDMAKQIFEQYGEWTYRIVIAVLLVANLYLQQNFVTRTEYDASLAATNKSLSEIKAGVGDLKTSLLLLQTKIETISDHESRLRHLEKGTGRRE